MSLLAAIAALPLLVRLILILAALAAVGTIVRSLALNWDAILTTLVGPGR